MAKAKKAIKADTALVYTRVLFSSGRLPAADAYHRFGGGTLTTLSDRSRCRQPSAHYNQGVNIDAELREFRRAVTHVQDTFHDVFVTADADNMLLWIFGSNDDARRATAVAETALSGGPAHVERVSLVTCSESQTPRMLRGVNEPAGDQPKIIGQDDRGVFLRCLPSGPHEHDWGGTYEPMNARTYS